MGLVWSSEKQEKKKKKKEEQGRKQTLRARRAYALVRSAVCAPVPRVHVEGSLSRAQQHELFVQTGSWWLSIN